MFVRNILTIWKKEVKGYFYTPLAYVFIGLFTLLMGFMFLFFLQTYMIYTQRSQFGMAPTITIDRLAEAFYANMHFIIMMILPLFTFRLFTEESRQNTLVLLMTSPIRTWELVLSKFKAASTVLLIKLGLTLIFPAFLVLYSAGGAGAGPDLGIVASTYLGLSLIGLAYVAIGMFWSSITESVLVALVLTFVTNFTFGILFCIASQGVDAGIIQSVLKHLCFNEHLMNFLKGTIELRSVVYLVTIIFVLLFLTNRSIESRSWRS
jgi:ABC-2 type transport system permease protein